jgi:hypothetical protein
MEVDVTEQYSIRDSQESEVMTFEAQLCTGIPNASTSVAHLRISNSHEKGPLHLTRDMLDMPIVVGVIVEMPEKRDGRRESSWELLFASRAITTTDGGEVVVPVDALSLFSDEELGRAVRGVAAYAQWACIETRARLFNRDRAARELEWRMYSHDWFVLEYEQEEIDSRKWLDVSPDIRLYNQRLRTIIRQHNPEAGFVYCLHDGVGHYKIGRSKVLSQRLRQLGTQPPFPIELKWAFQAVDAVTYESHLHNALAKHRLSGEWFSLTEDQVEMLRKDTSARTFFDLNGNQLPIDDWGF